MYERIAGLERAVARLAEVLVQPKNEFLRDAAVKRLELTFEPVWKAPNSYLAYQGFEVRPPREASRRFLLQGSQTTCPAFGPCWSDVTTPYLSQESRGYSALGQG